MSGKIAINHAIAILHKTIITFIVYYERLLSLLFRETDLIFVCYFQGKAVEGESRALEFLRYGGLTITITITSTTRLLPCSTLTALILV